MRNTATDLDSGTAYLLDFRGLTPESEAQLISGAHLGESVPDWALFHIQIIPSLPDQYLEFNPVAKDGSLTLPEQAIHMHVCVSLFFCVHQ